MKNNTMKCPECAEIATSTHWYEAVTQFTAPVVIRDGEIVVDYDHATEKETTEADDDPETCVCDHCGKDIQIADIEIVDAGE